MIIALRWFIRCFFYLYIIFVYRQCTTHTHKELSQVHRATRHLRISFEFQWMMWVQVSPVFIHQYLFIPSYLLHFYTSVNIVICVCVCLSNSKSDSFFFFLPFFSPTYLFFHLWFVLFLSISLFSSLFLSISFSIFLSRKLRCLYPDFSLFLA